jgi:hypothetical protein
VLAGALEGDVFIGQRAQELRGLLKIRYPLEHGIVTDWDDMERIWEWVYGEGLKTLSEEVSIPPTQIRGIELGGSFNLNPEDQETRLLTEIAASCLINRTTSQPSK